MKKLVIVMALLALGVTAYAEDKSDGCGLGWQVTNKTSFLATTTRGTTNAFVPPTFGMTSGTMGCAQHSFAKKDEPAVFFVATNYDALSIEMAQGRGETLEGFARTMGCDDAATAAFGPQMQSKYRAIMNGKTTPVQMFERVKQEVHSNPALAAGCNA